MSTTYTIPRKMSNTGSIHDLASDLYDRDIVFPRGAKYAVVLAAYYGGNSYTTHRSESAAVRASRRCRKSHKVIDSDGNIYGVDYDCLVRL